MENAREIPACSLPNNSQRMLLKASLLLGEKGIRNWREWRAGRDIDSLDGASFRLLPLLYANLQKHRIADPELGKLRGISRFHWCKTQILMDVMLSLVSILQKEQIDVLLLKGGALIIQYYNSPALRPMSDFDLMVPKGKLAQAIDILQRHGWKPDDEFMLSEPSVTAKRHSQSFRNAQGTECDLHWTPLSAATWPGAEVPFWEHSEIVSFRNLQVRVLSPSYQLFHIIVHGGYYNRFPPIRWVADALMILRKDGDRIDWPSLMGLGKTYTTTSLLKNGLLFLAQEFEGVIPTEIVKEFSRERPGWREKIEHKALAKQIPDYRIDLLFLKAWMRHCQKTPNRTLFARILGFPAFLKMYVAIRRWRDTPAFICKRLGKLLRHFHASLITILSVSSFDLQTPWGDVQAAVISLF